jgi:hypothetical protein
LLNLPPLEEQEVQNKSQPPTYLPPEDAVWNGIREREQWNHIELYKAVYDTLFALPGYFKSELKITGVLATDLYTFNSALGATIENQIVDALNELREEWDRENRYRTYRFVRQAQHFPDVILRGSTPEKENDVILGIELKGWYALAKEREPSFRFTASPNICAPWDLLCVFPWALSEVISGTPQLFNPFVTGARYAAEYRNWYWQHGMSGKSDKTIKFANLNQFYPASKSEMNDQPVSDSGNNFGRLARYGILDEYMNQLRREKLSGIPIDAWQRFLGFFKEERQDEEISKDLDRLLTEVGEATAALTDEELSLIRENVSQILVVLEKQN